MSATGAARITLHPARPHAELGFATPMIVASLHGNNPPADPASYQIQITWGDDTPTEAGVAIAGESGTHRIKLGGSHIFSRAGVFIANITASVNGVSVGTISDKVRVGVGAGGRVLHPHLQSPFTSVVAEVSAKPTGNLAINWGDGTASAPTVVHRAGKYAIIGSHVYPAVTTPMFFSTANPEGSPVTVSTAQAFESFTVTVTETGATGSSSDSAANPKTIAASIVEILPPGPFSLHTIRVVSPDMAPVLAGAYLQPNSLYLASVPQRLKTVQVAIDWGDGSAVEHATATNDVNGDLSSFGTAHLYPNAGTYTEVETFVAEGKKLATASRTITVVQNSAGGIILTTTTGTKFTGVVGTLTPLDFVPVSVGIEWGDGTQSNGTFVAVGSGQYQLTGAHTYAKAGTYRVTAIGVEFGLAFPIPTLFHTYDRAPREAMVQSTMIVTGSDAQVAPISGQAVALTVPDAAGDRLENVPLAQLQGLSPDPYSADIYAVVDWGDGTDFRGMGYPAIFADGTFTVSGSHEYFDQTTYRPGFVNKTLNATVTFYLNDHEDMSKNTILGSTVVPIHAVANTSGGMDLSLTHGITFNGSIGSFVPYTAGTPLATIDWGDGTDQRLQRWCRIAMALTTSAAVTPMPRPETTASPFRVITRMAMASSIS